MIVRFTFDIPVLEGKTPWLDDLAGDLLTVKCIAALGWAILDETQQGYIEVTMADEEEALEFLSAEGITPERSEAEL